MSLFEELRRRRVVQTLIGYFVGLWGGAQVIDFVEQRYGLSPSWVELFLLGYLTLLPGVIVFAWSKGAPERQNWSKIAIALLGLNAVLTVGALTAGVTRMDLGPVTETVVVETEEGEAVEVEVPRAAYRSSITMSFPVASQVEADARDAAVALEFLLESDLVQNPFLELRSAWFEQQRAVRAGLEDATRMPRALVHEAARSHGTDVYLVATVESIEVGYRFAMELRSTDDARPLADTSFEGPDLFVLADEMSLWILETLEVPTAGIENRPVADVTTTSAEALQAVVEGSMTQYFDQDLEGGLAQYQRAIELDPTFAIAHLAEYQTLALLGRQGEGVASIDAAMKYSYRLNERTKYMVRANYHAARGEIDKTLAVLDMWCTQHPTDPAAIRMQALNRAMVQDDAVAEDAARRLLELLPDDVGAMQVSLQVAQMIGDPVLQLDSAQLWTQVSPHEAAPLLALARAERANGDLAAAVSTLEQASLLAPNDIDVQRQIGDLHIRVGDFDAARELFDELLATEIAGGDRASVLELYIRLEHRAGRVDRAVELIDAWDAIAQDAYPPGQYGMLLSARLDVYADDGRPEKAHERIAALRASTPPMLHGLFAIGRIESALADDDTTVVREELDRYREAIETLGAGVLQWQVEYFAAQLELERGNPEGALATIDRATELDPSAFVVGRVRARALRELGRFDEALQAVERQLSVDPSHAMALLERARVLEAAGRKDEAVEAYESLLTVWSDADPGHTQAAVARASLERLRRDS